MACPVLAQEVLAEFMRDGGYDHHMRRLRAALRDQVRAVAAAVARFFPPNCAASLPQGGFMLWIELPRDVDSRQVFVQAKAAHIGVAPGAASASRGATTTASGCSAANHGHLASRQVCNRLDPS